MKFGWNQIDNAHILKAIEEFDTGIKKCPQARSTFLIHNGKIYPAKHIRGMAYRIAFGKEISKEEYSGGLETVRFFENLGFEVKHERLTGASKNMSRENGKNLSQKNVVAQKNALQVLLQKKLGIIQTEKKFDWLKTPDINNLPSEYVRIYNTLKHYRDNKDFFTTNYALSCDIYFEDVNLIIEYDENQHFTIPRKLTLENYPSHIQLGFSKEYWIKSCEKINAKDNAPHDRDESRSFYDSVRDIEAFKKGFKLIRIKHGDVDWEAEDSKIELDKILSEIRIEKMDSREINGEENKISLEYEGPEEFKGELFSSVEIGNNVRLRNEVVMEKRKTIEGMNADSYDWRSLEIEFQRIKLNYLKWFFYFNPPSQEIIPKGGKKDKFKLIDNGGNSFLLFPCGSGAKYLGGGTGSVKLPPGCFKSQNELSSETDDIKGSLDKRVKKLKDIIKQELQKKNYNSVWKLIQDYYWLKVGIHEYAYDCYYELDKETRYINEKVRENVVVTMRYGQDMSKKIPQTFSNSDIEDFIKNHFTWVKYAACSYDCGPMAWGKKGYVSYSEVLEERRKYNKDNRREYDTAINIKKMDRAKGMYLLQEYAVNSISDVYEFICLYHREPMSKISTYGDFLNYKSEIAELIENVQNEVNNLIDREKLDLKKYQFVPGI